MFRAVAFWLVVGILSLSGCGNASAPSEIAEEWFTAYEAGDQGQLHSVMAEDMTYLCINCGYDRAVTNYFASGGGYEQDLRDSRLLALGEGTLNPTCSQTGNAVTCTTERLSKFGFVDADGTPSQIDTSTYEFTFSNGKVTNMVVTRTGGNLFDFNRIQDYRQWVAARDPDAHDELFVLGTILLATEEQFHTHQALVKQYFANA